MTDTVNKRVAWVAYTNQDLTEGRGRDIPIAVCELEATAIRLAKKRYVQGSDGPVRAIELLKIGSAWYAPIVAVISAPPTKEDCAYQTALDTRKEALSKAKALGLTDSDLAVLGGCGMNAIDQLKSVLCNTMGKCCIAGSDEDRAIVDLALQSLSEPAPAQEQQFTADELDLMRQWFESMQDTNRSFVIDADKKLHQKIIAAIQAAPRAEQPRKAVKLSDDEIVAVRNREFYENTSQGVSKFARAIEAAFIAKNNLGVEP